MGLVSHFTGLSDFIRVNNARGFCQGGTCVSNFYFISPTGLALDSITLADGTVLSQSYCNPISGAINRGKSN